MLTVIFKRHDKRHELCIDNPEDLIALLIVLQNSDEVSEYKVINSDSGVVKDFKVSFGWGNEFFSKNAPDGFTWSNNLI
ncbi:hypothetical protein [Pseudomonas phage vB_PaeM_PS119XW]|uniref:Uncharacterized protein n=1 Tax=Pseudomonas phage vB_PaeM_PS119XW TaxID=2601632 RepID=A0A5C1K9V4_9CAUD|nr:hypothetical protein PP933_gp355 [Pseudomonas phage vB_PaeM_PS119XW]QEM42084.1 hypothetical protein [Pseudomonas phage vB_PaeM_PS119XW]